MRKMKIAHAGRKSQTLNLRVKNPQRKSLLRSCGLAVLRTTCRKLPALLNTMSQTPSDLGQKHWVKVNKGPVNTKAKKVEVEKDDSALDKYFNRATSECEEKAWEEPHHSENCDNVSSQTGVMPDSYRGSLSTRSEVSHFEGVESDKEGSSLAGASDKSYEHENSTFAEAIGWTNNPATWPGVMNQDVRGYLIQIWPSTVTT